jgi:hypothetical protein
MVTTNYNKIGKENNMINELNKKASSEAKYSLGLIRSAVYFISEASCILPVNPMYNFNGKSSG